MVSAEVQIAKASLWALLFNVLPREEIDAFFDLLSDTFASCTRSNVQKCKQWIMKNVAENPARTGALAKYLVTLSKSYGPVKEKPGEPSAKRRRLHILYVVNDVLHATKGGLPSPMNVDKIWGPFLPSLVTSTVVPNKYPKHHHKLEALLALWREKGYFSAPTNAALKDALAGKYSPAASEQTSSILLAKDVPYILPALHGDATASWCDLPTSTWLSAITPNSSKSIGSQSIRATPLAAGPASSILVEGVKKLVTDASLLFANDASWDDDSQFDLNQMGDRVLLDEITGEVVGGVSYYGWTRQFCMRMKERNRNPVTRQDETRADRSRSRGRQQSYKGSSRNRSSSRSESYSPPPTAKRRRYSPSTSRSRTRSGSRSRRRRYSRSPQRSSHRSRSRSNQRYQPSSDHQPLPPPPPPQSMPPAPPPRPPNYLGQWPPPPPPLPPYGGGFNNQQPWAPDPAMIAHMMNNLQAGVSPTGHPFIPPQPSFPSEAFGHSGRGQHQGYGQSYGGNNYHGRGGGNGYRERGRSRGGGYGRGRDYSGNY